MPEKAKRRKRKGKIEVLVREKKSRHRKARTYWRKKRPKGKKRKLGKKVTMRLVQDEYGRILGFKPVRRKK